MSATILRWYQEDAINQTAAAMAKGVRVACIQLPTGSGKSKTACGMIARAVAKGSEVVFIAHRRNLVTQFCNNLDEWGIFHGVVMRGSPRERAASVQVASRDTLLERAVRKEHIDLPPAKLVIVDEFRHAAEGAYREILDEYSRRGARIVGLDATPAHSDGKGLGPWCQIIVSPAKPSQLIAQGHLLPAKCYAPDRVKTRGGRIKRGIAGNLVESWIRFANGLPTVLFTSRVQHSRDAVEAFSLAGIPAVHIDAETHDDDRLAIFADVEAGKYKVVSNVGIMIEGTDLPCLGCAQFYMDINSRTAWIQRCGRILRPHGTQKFGVVIDHSAAVFRYGFPDEDTEWTLEGNVDDDWTAKKKAGQTEKVLYCGHCSLQYKGCEACPQCGRPPIKAPKSIFSPPKIERSKELLVEADRTIQYAQDPEDEKMRHWVRCLAVAKNQGRTCGAAAQIFKKKYGHFPKSGYPRMPISSQWRMKVTDVFPDFGRK